MAVKSARSGRGQPRPRPQQGGAGDAFHPDGAGAHAPAAGEAVDPLAGQSDQAAPGKARRRARKAEAGLAAQADRAPLRPRPTIPDPGAVRAEATEDTDEPASGGSGPVESEAELVWEDADTEADDDDEDAEPEGPILDVGTMPSLPSMPSADSRPSLPAVRARAGITRAGALERFLAEMGRYPLLTPSEEQDLTIAYYERQDSVAARKLVVHNLRLVVKMAYKYRRAWANVLDLIQEGNVGLVEAVRRFDPFKGAKFSTYATFWIRAYMLRYLLEHSRMVRISRTRVGRKLFFRLSKEREKLRAQGIEPGPKLLAERLGVGERELEEVVRHMDQSEVRLDAPMYADDASGGTMLDAMSGELASPEAQTYKREFDREVSSALEAFAATLTDPREQVAWREHLMAEDPASLSELGARFGVTKQRMGQIVAALRKRLKDHLLEVLGPDVQLWFSFEAE